MKIVGFEAEGGLRLGVVEGDQVIDLQAVDAKVPGDLGAVLAANNGDLKPLGDIAKRAPASARRPLQGSEIRPAGGAAGQDPLPRAELSRARQGRLAARQHPEIPDHLHALPHLDGAARAADRAPEGLRAARLRGRDDAGRRQARQASHDGERHLLHRRLFVLERRLGARIPAQDHAMGHGQELRPHRRLRPVDGDGRRTARRRQGAEDREPAQRHRHAVATTPTT